MEQEKKLLKEYNKKLLAEIEQKAKQNEKFAEKTKEKFVKKLNKKYNVSSLENRLSSASNPSSINKMERQLNELNNKIDIEADRLTNQKIMEKWIRRYRTLIDESFEGGQIETDIEQLYVKRKIRQPGILDGRLIRTNAQNGMFYTFIYDPKGKDYLEYYDRVPLIIVLSSDKDGFTALNWHLIEPEERVLMYDLMLRYKRGVNYRAYIDMTWDRIKSMKMFRMGKPIIRRYLYKQIRSKIIRVPDDDWEVMLMLPTQRFIGMAPDQVYTRNKRKAYKS